MTAGPAITRAFGSEERRFILRVGEWREVEKQCDAGLGEIVRRIAPLVQLQGHPGGAAALPGGLIGAISGGYFGTWRIDDLRVVLIQGLIGGGMTSTEAGALVRLVFDEEVARGRGPAMVYVKLVFDILMGALVGWEDEPLTQGEKKPAKARTPRAGKSRSRAGNSASQISTAPHA